MLNSSNIYFFSLSLVVSQQELVGWEEHVAIQFGLDSRRHGARYPDMKDLYKAQYLQSICRPPSTVRRHGARL